MEIITKNPKFYRLILKPTVGSTKGLLLVSDFIAGRHKIGVSLKVLHVITTLDKGGAENQLRSLVNCQARTGLEVSVLSLRKANKIENSGFSSCVKVYSLVELRKPSFLKGILDFLSSKALVHAHLPRAEILARLMLVGRRNIFVISRHNTEPLWPFGGSWLSMLLSQLVTRRSDAIIAISDSVREYQIAQRYISKQNLNKVKVIHYGIELTKAKPSYNLDRFRFRIGTIARLVAQKDISTLIMAFFMLSARDPNPWKLYIAGEGDMKSTLEKQITDLGIGHRVFLLGRTDKVDDFLANIDIFALSSRYEGFGLVLLEAMRSCLPIVATRTSAIPEVLGMSHKGLVPVGDPESMSKKFENLVEVGNRSRLIEEGTSRLKMFDIEEKQIQLHNLYSHLLKTGEF